MLQFTPARSRLRRAAGGAAGTLAVAAIAAGCGSSSSGGSSSAGSSSGAGASVNLAEAQQVVTQALQRPAQITVSAPVAKSVPSGKKVVFISCGVSVCQQQGQIVATAARALGWTASTISTDGTPASVQAAYQTALRQGVDAIVTTAALRAEIASQIPKLNAQKIVISDASSTDPVAPPFIYNTSTASQNTRIERMLAAEVVADSKGNANTLYVNLPAFTILKPLAGAYQSYYNHLCP
jgi:ribose transport system substrate-binding protein